MRTFITAAVVTLVAVLWACSAQAFSPIGNVDGWDKGQLARAGISVRPWRHALQGEDPPQQWVQVTFDGKTVPKNQPIVMTAWFRAKGDAVTAARAERLAGDGGSVSLIFCVGPDESDLSNLDIFIWADAPGGGHAAHGYRLTLRRIAELAREQSIARLKRVSAGED